MIRSSGGTDSPAPATGSGASTRSGGARGFHILSQVHSESPTEILEAYTQAGVKLLRRIKRRLESDDDPIAADLLETVVSLQKTAKPVPPVIGLFGSTGTGKSSLINAILEEQ